MNLFALIILLAFVTSIVLNAVSWSSSDVQTKNSLYYIVVISQVITTILFGIRYLR